MRSQQPECLDGFAIVDMCSVTGIAKRRISSLSPQVHEMTMVLGPILL